MEGGAWGLRVDLGVGVEDGGEETGGWRPDGRQPGGVGGGGWWGALIYGMKQIWQYGPVIEDSTTMFFA
jgi:hypothetical protein